MAATCASCRRPIRNGHKIALSGSEVFHRECAMAGTTESAGNKNRARLLELQAEIDRKMADLERVRSELDNLRRISTDAHKENDRLASLLRGRDIELRIAKTSLDKVTGAFNLADLDANMALNRRDAALRERDVALRERDAARSQVALLETLSRNVAVAPETTPVAVTAPTDHMDASEIRFSLLELDKP